MNAIYEVLVQIPGIGNLAEALMSIYLGKGTLGLVVSIIALLFSAVCILGGIPQILDKDDHYKYYSDHLKKVPEIEGKLSSKEMAYVYRAKATGIVMWLSIHIVTIIGIFYIAEQI